MKTGYVPPTKRVYGARFEVKTLDTDQGTFGGYGAVFGNEDMNGDIIERGAFSNTLREAKSRGGPFLWPLLRMHNEGDPIGGITSAVEDSHGLLITGACDMRSDAGRAVFSGIKMGYMNGLSIGYNTERSTRDAKGVRHLLEVKLWEISAVTTGYAANTDAKVDPVSVKTKGTTMDKTQDAAWERVFGEMKKSLSTALVVPLPEVKARSAYRTDAEWERAVEAYHEARYHQVGLPTPVQTEQWDRKVAFRDAQDADLAARCRNGSATVSEMLAYNRATGWTPSGVPLVDDSERFARAYEGVYATLEEIRNG
jgi:HK97 family phage prohead protease